MMLDFDTKGKQIKEVPPTVNDQTVEKSCSQHYVIDPVSKKPKYIDGTYDKDGLVESLINIIDQCEWKNKAEQNTFLSDFAAKFGISPTVVNMFSSSDDIKSTIQQLGSYVNPPTEGSEELSIGSTVAQEDPSLPPSPATSKVDDEAQAVADTISHFSVSLDDDSADDFEQESLDEDDRW